MKLTTEQAFAAALLGMSHEEFILAEREAELRAEIAVYEKLNPGSTKITKAHIELTKIVLGYPPRQKFEMPANAARLRPTVSDDGDIRFTVD